MSEQYRPPGSSERHGISTVAKVLLSTLVVGVIALVIALGVGVNGLVQQWDKLTSSASDQGGDERTDDSARQTDESPLEKGDDQEKDKLTSSEIFSGAPHEDVTVTLDDKTVHAKRIGRWDRASCDGLGRNGAQAVLQKHGCEYAVEQALSGKSGRYWTGNMILAFPDEQSANAAARAIDPDDMVFGFEQYERFEHVGMGDSSKEFLVVSTTVYDEKAWASADAGVRDDASTLTGFMQAEMKNYFLFR